jgi:hypothetical protein
MKITTDGIPLIKRTSQKEKQRKIKKIHHKRFKLEGIFRTEPNSVQKRKKRTRSDAKVSS